MKKLLVVLVPGLLLANLAVAGNKTDRGRDGFIGPVKTVRIETAQFSNKSGTWVEGPREPSESTIYDQEGRKTVEAVHYPDSSMDFKSVYTYDAQGNLTKGVEHDAKDSLVFRWTYTHDPKRNRIEETRYDANGVLFSKTVYTYDARENLIEETRYGANSSLESRWVYTYNTIGNKIEEAFYVTRFQSLLDKADSSPDFKSVYTYDAKGNITEQTRYNADGSLEFNKIYTYEFDPAGNWVKQTAAERVTRFGKSDFEPSEVTYRTITYYSIGARMP